MSDLFHPDVDMSWQVDIFAVMALTPQHTYTVLTKRPNRMRQHLKGLFWDDVKHRAVEIARGIRFPPHRYNYNHHNIDPRFINGILPNVIGMVTAENQKRADARIPLLIDAPFALRGVSIEPMLGPINLSPWVDVRLNAIDRNQKLDWVIVGGETGPGARPMHPDWVRSLRDQCSEAGVPFFFKSWGDWFPRSQWEHNPELELPDDDELHGSGVHVWLDGEVMHRVGKKRAGRLLDGVEWNEYPEVAR
jgi:protein gp37